MSKAPNLKRRLFFLSIGSFLVSTAPLFLCVVANWEKYVKTPGDAVSLSLGGMLVLLFLVLKVLGKLKMPSRIVFYGAVFAMAYFLKALLSDLVLLSGMALLGETVDFIFFQRAIRKTKENVLIGKTADATAAQVEEVVKKYIGRV
ncbi:MAG: hypothetical protein E7609_05275 [Ruminococcaceae bacterium]|nr:hypothetical protein [Oscillospiraceae bacterium]